MPPKRGNEAKRDSAWLEDMLKAATKIQRWVAGRTNEEYKNDEYFQSAIERQVEIIGEAARGLSDTFRDQHPEIPWRAIMAQRHRLAHEYGEVDPDLIWKVATFHVPVLIPQLQKLISQS